MQIFLFTNIGILGKFLEAKKAQFDYKITKVGNTVKKQSEGLTDFSKDDFATMAFNVVPRLTTISQT